MVVSQINKEYEAMGLMMQRYLYFIRETTNVLWVVRFEHTSREKNLKMDKLFKLARYKRKGRNNTIIH